MRSACLVSTQAVIAFMLVWPPTFPFAETLPPEGYLLAEYAGGGRVTEAHLLAHLAAVGKPTEELIAKDPLLDTLPQYIAQAAANQILLASASVIGMDRDPDYLAELRDKRRELRVKALARERFQIGEPVSEESAREYYEAHPREFPVQPTAWFQHIFIPAGSPEDVGRIMSELRSGEVSFASAAARYSSGVPVENRDEVLGPVSRGVLLPEVEKAVFGNAVGSISDPIRTERGTEIIHVVRRDEVAPFGNVVDEARTAVAAERAAAYRSFTDALRAKAVIEIATPILPHLAEGDFVVARIDGEVLTIHDLRAFIPRRLWKREPITEEKDIQGAAYALVTRVLMAREAERLRLGEDAAAERQYRQFADFHLRQMTYSRVFADQIPESRRGGFVGGDPREASDEALDAVILLELLELSGYQLLVVPTEQLRRRWLTGP